MNLLEHIDFDGLFKVYLFANTPKYLYRHFRENESLKELTKRTIPDVLVAEYHKLHDKKKRELSETVLAYALMVALTHYQYPTALNALRKLDTTHLEWGSDLKEIALAQTRVINIAHVIVTPLTPTTHTLTTFTSSVTHNYRKIKIG